MDDPNSVEGKAVLIVKYFVNAARGSALAGDVAMALDTLQFKVAYSLAALGSVCQSDEMFATLPDLRAKWEQEALEYVKVACPAMPKALRNGLKDAAPADQALIYQRHERLSLKDFAQNVDVRALVSALKILDSEERPLAERFDSVLAVLLAAPPMVQLQPRELAGKVGGTNGN